MFYVVISEDGFCYIPTVTIVDHANIKSYRGKTLPSVVSRNLVANVLDRGTAIFDCSNAREALNLACDIYKKMPRYRRQIGYLTDTKNPDVVRYKGMHSKGAGIWESEVADKYL